MLFISQHVRLPRTPGQILSLTAHLSFKSVTHHDSSIFNNSSEFASERNSTIGGRTTLQLKDPPASNPWHQNNSTACSEKQVLSHR